jgi:soluble lytic murein transglycosylase
MTRASWVQISGDKLSVVLSSRKFIWSLSLAVLCSLCAVGTSAAYAQSPDRSAQPAKSKKQRAPAKKSSAKKKSPTPKHKRKPASLRVRRVHRAFVASTSLRPMAQQLLQDRTPAAYAGVEAYARRHANEDAGSLAWLVAGYAHIVDHDYAKAIDPLNRAKASAGELGEYVTYYLGTAYLQSGRIAEAAATLSGFADKYPDSLLIRDVHVAFANTLLAEGKTQDAISILENDRLPPRSDVELALGRAYEAAGVADKALPALRNVYYNMPTSTEADQAGAELKKLGFNAATPSERKTRADLLAKARRYSDAADEYKELLNQVSATERTDVELALATALERSGRGKEAKQVVNSMSETTGDATAQRLWLLGEIARGSDDDDEFIHVLGQLRESAPTSSWFEQSLLSAGNMYLLHRDYDKAIDAYRELQQRFPSGSRASYAHWKVAWLTLRKGENNEAARGFEEQITWYPAGPEIPAALYWRARLAEEENDFAKARAFYEKLSGRFRNYYYAELGRERLKALKASDDPPSYAILDHIPALPVTKIEDGELPSDNLRVQKAQLLANGALIDAAARELQAAATEEKGSWGISETARIFQDSGHYDRAIEVVKHTVPNYFALEIPQLPRSYWEALFPKPYWTDLKRFSSQNSLDPYLVASLIRQESEFNPGAVSNKNAAGLMQLLPSTGKKVAKQVKLRRFNAGQLFTPTVNLQLGTRYFRSMVDKFGSFEYALAAYNAGTDRVQDWLSQGKYRDPQEFVESIPFTETREYVQAILRNSNVYRQLYGTP